MSLTDVPAPALPDRYAADEIILYGVRIDSSGTAELPFGDERIVLGMKGRESSREVAMTVVYGYAYEGQCYRLGKPKLIVFKTGELAPEEDARGCGFGGDYKMWRITSKTQLMELSPCVDDAQKLILDANLPGNRPPNTYGNDMQLAHRGGRLTVTGGS